MTFFSNKTDTSREKIYQENKQLIKLKSVNSRGTLQKLCTIYSQLHNTKCSRAHITIEKITQRSSAIFHLESFVGESGGKLMMGK